MASKADSKGWDGLYDVAVGQEGHFTTAQAARVGISPQLLAHHLRSGRVRRLQRGIYRLVRFPEGEHEDLVVAWLWTGGAGVASHETALALHGLSDLLPSRIHMTLPESWRSRRLRVPDTLSLAFAEIDDAQRQWSGCVPVTSPERTISDCIESGVAVEFVEQAIKQALDRGLIGSRVASGLRRMCSEVMK